MMTTEHWAIIGQAVVFMFAMFGLIIVGYLAGRELNR